MLNKINKVKFHKILVYIVIAVLLAMSVFSNVSISGAANSTPPLQLTVNSELIQGAYRDTKYGVIAPYNDVFTALGYKTTVKNGAITAQALVKPDKAHPGIISVTVSANLITIKSIENSGNKTVTAKMAMNLLTKNGKLFGQLKPLTDAMKLFYSDDVKKNVVSVMSQTGNNGKIFTDAKNAAHQELMDKIDSVTASISRGIKFTPTPIDKDLKDPDVKKRVAAYLGLADDMAYAQIMNLLDNNMFMEAAKAVKEYPHPLLLNNFGAILLECGRRNDALYMFEAALAQDQQNPVLLTNAGNLYFELGKDSQAESYARKALSRNQDFGPAYQLLTIVHLKNKHYILTIETMIKSMKYCFNDISVRHVDSFLDAVDELDPLVDKYPMEPSLLDELYDIASKEVDAGDVNSSTDVPEAQVKIKPLSFQSAETAQTFSKQLFAEYKEIVQKTVDIQGQIGKLTYRADNYYDEMTDGRYKKASEFIKLKTLRQIYALKILNSFYMFKIRKDRAQLEEKLEKPIEDMQKEIETIRKDYTLRIDNATKALEGKTGAALLGDKTAAAELKKGLINIQKMHLEREQRIYSVMKKYRSQNVADYSKHYNIEKQMYEEWWLKSGGLMKYIGEKDVFNDFDYKRQIKVCEFTADFIDNICDIGFEMAEQEGNIKAEQLLLDKLLQDGENQTKNGTEGQDEDNSSEQDKGRDEEIPDWEKQALSNFKEDTDLPPIGIEGKLFGAGLSADYDGRNLSAGVDIPMVKGGVSQDLDSGESCYFGAYGATAAGSTEWLTERKFVENTLKNAGPVTKGLGKTIGKIGFGFSSGTKEGNYVCIDKTGAITDKGKIYIRESGADIGAIGKTTSVEVKKSLMTGIAIKEKSTTYKFMFASLKVKD